MANEINVGYEWIGNSMGEPIGIVLRLGAANEPDRMKVHTEVFLDAQMFLNLFGQLARTNPFNANGSLKPNWRQLMSQPNENIVLPPR